MKDLEVPALEEVVSALANRTGIPEDECREAIKGREEEVQAVLRTQTIDGLARYLGCRPPERR